MEQTIEAVIKPVDAPTLRQETPHAVSVRENALVKLRIRWPFIVVAALLGAAAGLLVSSGPTTYDASATLRITDAFQDTNRTKQTAQTVERVATSNSVMETAARERGISTAALARRVSALWATDTDLIDITVRGTDPENTVRDANAVVASITKFYDEQTAVLIKELGDQGNDLLTSGQLKNTAAEAARSEGVGTALAQRQAAAAEGRTTVTLVDPASEAKANGLSTPVATVLGGFVGMALGAAAALLLPIRLRRVRKVSEIPVLLPGVLGLSADSGAAEVAGLFLESDQGDLAVVAMGVSDADAISFGADVVTMLQAHGTSAALVDATDTRNATLIDAGVPAHGSLAAFRALGQAGRANARRNLGATTLVMVTTARAESLGLLAGQHEVLAVVLAKSRRQSVRDLEAILTQLRHSDPSVALLS